MAVLVLVAARLLGAVTELRVHHEARAREAPASGEFDERLCGSRAQSTDPLTFVFESNGHCRTLQASLVWIELTQGEQDERRLELIIDTGDEAGWWEVHTAVGED